MGCGWLGKALGKALLEKGYKVKGSTTSTNKLENLSKQGITPFLIQLYESGIEGNIDELLSDLDVLIVNVPPNLRRQPQSNYVAKMQWLLKACIKAKVSNILFVSSTSVYGALEGEITEAVPPQPKTKSGKQLLKAEQLFLKESTLSVSIIRFGGLIGEDRHPINQLSGKTLKNGEDLVNLIHQKDCIHMILTIIENGYWNELFNGVYPYHPTKAEYYTSEAKKRGLPAPIYLTPSENVNKKKISFKNFYVKGHDLTTSIFS